MGEKTGIEWTDHTFNGWWGCTKVSPACDNCYAETVAQRFGVKWGLGEARRFFGDRHWNEPLKWNRKAEKARTPAKVFVNSMADVFDNEVAQEHRDRLWALMRATPWLKWLVLTKRISNAREMLPADWGDGYPNVALGITVINQSEAERDIPRLKAIPAWMRFLSCEPLLGRIDLGRCKYEDCPDMVPQVVTGGRMGNSEPPKCCDDPAAIVTGIDWIITGGESGTHARMIDPSHYRYLRDQCVAVGISFFFKQWGEWLGNVRVGKHAAGREIDGEMWSQFPAWASEVPVFQQTTGGTA